MTIKSDRWIRRMALEHRMIEPFVESQKGEGMVSYGVSSYGYDIRIADEFKIFTNVRTAMVDPKNFDENSFVDFKGDVCVIPPNSFALGRTVEYFRIPRNVLTICLGKSTYARCFSADTTVSLLDGTSPTLEEMAHRSLTGEMFWGYAMGEHGRIIAALLHAPRFIGRDSLIEITLDNDEKIKCTPDHKFIRRDGRTATANELRPGDSLMPLYRQLVRGYESVYQPVNGNLDATHRLADEWNVVHGIYENQPGTHRHHIDHDRRNNMPWNLIRLAASEHIRHHNEENYGADFDAEEHGQSIRDALARRAEDPEWREHFATVQRDRASRFWHDDKYADARERLRSVHLASWTEERRQQKREEMVQYFQDPAARAARGELSRRAWAADPGARRDRQREIARNIKIRPEITSEVVRRALNDTGSIRGAARLLGCDRSVFRRFPEVIAAVQGRPALRNHKITSIRELPGDHDVYCLTVPEAGNFALGAGVFVRNCGILTNVTPFEPAWEGYATLEISNTTPLPAKIYANEGIAQVLFFESDEECEVSYADKKGKYQSQVGITLPRILQKDASNT